MIEPLERRTLLTLLNLPIDFDRTVPEISALPGVPSNLHYSPGTGEFDVTNSFLTFSTGAVDPITGLPVDPTPILPSSLATPSPLSAIQIFVDTSGNFVSGAASGNDLLITGKLTVNNTTYDGTLLTGHVDVTPTNPGFGFDMSDPLSDPVFDFRFTPSGGALMPFFVGKDIGVYLFPESTVYDGTFFKDITSNSPKALIGPIDPLSGPTPHPLASPVVATTAHETAGGVVGSAQLSDTATLVGGNNATGTISFAVTQPDNTTVPVGTVTVTGDGTYEAPTFLATQVGTYTWHASYNGDASNKPATDDGTKEQVTTIKASPSVATVASKTAGGVVGSAMLSDSATITGGDAPVGTITFKLTAPDHTTTTETLNFSGDGTYTAPVPVLATQVGTYTWSASYAGDALNNTAADNGANETVTTIQAKPKITSTASPAVTLGTTAVTLGDSAVVTGGYNLTGSLLFTLTGPAGFLYIQSDTLNGNNTYTASAVLPSTGTVAGTYTWSVTYIGDPNNNSAQDQGGAAEQTVVSKASPTIVTTASAGGAVGTAVLSDSAMLSGGYSEAGILIFTLDQPNGTTLTFNPITVSGDSTYASPTVMATQVGTYKWHASYSGDANNNGVVDNGQNETAITVKASPTLTTTASQSNGNVVGASIPQDKAVLSGGFSESGAITFTLKAPDGSTASTQTVAVTGDGTYAPAGVVATKVGTYTWSASYSGDTLNNGAMDQAGAAEQVTTVNASPTVATQASENGNIAGIAVLSDLATVSGGYSPGGTITFTLTKPDGTTSTIGTVAMTGDGAYSSPTVVATQAGVYLWHASYGGDALNNTAFDNGQNESLTTVAPASISGVKYLDLTGNGFSSDDPGLGGVTINLYRADGSFVTSTTTASSGAVGSYSFPNLAGGNYVVKEVVQAGYLETGPALGNSYAVTANPGAPVSGINFDNYQKDCDLTNFMNISYSINGTTTVSDLRGHIHSGDVVTVTFTVANNIPPHQLSLVSYNAPGPSFDANTAALQTIYNQATGTFGPGVHVLSVKVPDCYFQIDFVCGPAIDHLGPAGSNIFYSAQGRLISADNGGNTAVLANAGTISGAVFKDCNNNGVPDAGEALLGGITVNLKSASGLSLTHITAADGSYTFSNLPMGTYAITTTTPAAFLTGKQTPGKLANTSTTVGSVTGANSIGNITLGTGQNLVNYYSGELDPASLSGFVYVDLNNNGVKDSIEQGIFGVKLTLSGTNDLGTVTPTAITTQADGSYSFSGLRPGTYTITETSPSGFADGKDTAGTVNGVTDGTAGSDILLNVLLTGCNSNGINYNFGEKVPATPVGAGQFATIGFWHNSNGQAVINCFNGSSSSKLLGNWLASSFPHLFGASNVYIATSLAGLTNAQVAAAYNGLFTPTGTAKNTYVQAFAVALGLYADAGFLGGTSLVQNGLAAKYGFKVTPAGAGTFNVGSNGAAFGVPNGTLVQVMQILQILDGNFSSSSGLFFGGDQAKTSAANTVLNGINTGGDISLVTTDSVSTGGSQPLVTALHPLQSGTMVLAVDALPGDAAQTAAEQLRIDDAIASLNGALSSRGVTFVEIHGDDSVAADVHLHFAATSAIGGADQGVLGVTEAGGEITIITGWNYFFDSGAAAPAANQYDFQTVITHELGHSLGLGHSTDGNSVMYPFLGTGEVRHVLTANDLAIIDQDASGSPEPLRAVPRTQATPVTGGLPSGDKKNHKKHATNPAATGDRPRTATTYATLFSAFRIQNNNDSDTGGTTLLAKYRHRRLF